MPHGLKIQSLSPYIQPYFQRWSQPDATEKQIEQEFKEILEQDFGRVDPVHYEVLEPYFDKVDDRAAPYQCAYYRHLENDKIYAATFDQTYQGLSPYIPAQQTFYRLYDFSWDIKHKSYLILGHEGNVGECLTHPVPHSAPHISVAKNELIALRPVEVREYQIEYLCKKSFLTL